ncbi:MAG: GNAT family N-acetyltransferase [Actinomycetota bacterium]
MDIHVRRDPETIQALTDDWCALWDRDLSASLFQRPEYLGIWLTEFGADRNPCFIEIRDGGELRGLAALSVDADGVLRFLGDHDVTDYFGPLAAPDDHDAVADAVVEAIARVDGWERAELLGLGVDTGWDGAIARAAKAAGLSVDERAQDVCPRVALGGTYDDYLASLDGKLRHEIKRKARKLEREAGSYTVRMVTGEDLHEDMELFFDMHRSSEGPKGHFLHWGMSGFFILLARTFAKKGWLRLTFLEQGGRTVAGVFSFAARGIWNVYNSAFDQSMRELAPGMVLMAETIKLAADEGSTVFDLLRGDEPYKYRFGARDVALRALSLGRA